MMNAIAVSPSALAVEMLRLLEPAMDEATAGRDDVEGSRPEGKKMPAEFQRFVGSYDESPWGGETAVFPWKGGLAILWLPTMSPSDELTVLQHVEGNTFRRERDDGEPGETYVFVEDDSGRITGMRYHSNTYPRLE
jgi:hypothetical protein